MEVFLNRVDGVDDAIVSMFLSKRTLTRELELEIRKKVFNHSLFNPKLSPVGALTKDFVQDEQLLKWLNALLKWCPNHITLARFIDFSFTVYGLHRAGQDDLDAHAMRMNNRIIRSSTRLADFSNGELSHYYQEKIIPTDTALSFLGIDVPNEITYNGKTYVKAVNGYILKGMENNKDVKRGLYMLSIPSNFIFRIQCTEFAHVYKERKKGGAANAEVQEAVESMATQAEKATAGLITREILLNIKN